MKALFLLTVISFVFSSSVIAQDSWLTSVEEGFALAKKLNKKVLIEVGEETEDGSIFIENRIWNDSLVESQLQNYIPVSVNLDYRSPFYRKHEIDLLPCILIFSADGDKLYQQGGFQNAQELADLLYAFHFKTLKLNRLNEIYRSDNDKMGRLQKAEEYLYLYFYCPETLQPYFKAEGIWQMRGLTKSFSKTEEHLTERSEIISSAQLLMENREEKVIKNLNKILKSTESSQNKALIYFYLAIANIMSGDSEKVKLIKEQLTELKTSEATAIGYLEKLDKLVN